MPLRKAVLFSSLWAFALGQLEQPEISISRGTNGSAHVPCKASMHNFNSIDIHWYRQKPNQGLEHLMLVRTNYNQRPLGGTNKKLEASKNTHTSSSSLKINLLKKEDEAIYYCAYWDSHSVGDKMFKEDISPKPTVFLPSIAETDLHKAGTYLCLLENFFPDIINIHWKEKDSNVILRSQQGETVKTQDTYMKFSWLTVTGGSLNRQHQCVVQHENNKGRVDQEILFPSVNEVVITKTPREDGLKDESVVNTTKPACLKEENDVLWQQHTSSTSAFYTYLLLLLKSALHGILVAFHLCRRSAICHQKKSTS